MARSRVLHAQPDPGDVALGLWPLEVGNPLQELCHDAGVRSGDVLFSLRVVEVIEEIDLRGAGRVVAPADEAVAIGADRIAIRAALAPEPPDIATVEASALLNRPV